MLINRENHAADNRLRTQLELDQIAHFRITGCSADLAHHSQPQQRHRSQVRLCAPNLGRLRPKHRRTWLAYSYTKGEAVKLSYPSFW